MISLSPCTIFSKCTNWMLCWGFNIYRIKCDFVGVYQCVNSAMWLTNWVKSEVLYVSEWTSITDSPMWLQRVLSYSLHRTRCNTSDNVYYIMILFKQFYWLSCCHLTFRKIWYCLIKTCIDSLSLSLSIALCTTS